MVSRVFSAGLSGIDGYIVTVECFLSGGLPRLDVVGLPTGAVSEAGERVRAAAKGLCPLTGPVSRLTVNLAPADTKKAGTAYDLPILLSILAAAGEIDAPPDNALFFGELSLTGELRPVCGALSMALAARDAGFKTVFVPAMNAAEASYASGVTVFPIRTLNELLGHLNGRKAAHAVCSSAQTRTAGRCAGFCACARSARGQTRARDRGCRRTQRASFRTARFGQEHGCKALFHHPAAAV